MLDGFGGSVSYVSVKTGYMPTNRPNVLNIKDLIH